MKTLKILLITFIVSISVNKVEFVNKTKLKICSECGQGDSPYHKCKRIYY